jgi:site-specific DNA recombinase
MTDLTKAAGYIRVSTDEQAREGYSLDAQRHAIEAHCAAQGWKLTQVYEDAGVSGKSKNREGLRMLLADAERGDFQRVVFLRLDRLSRRLRDVLEVSDDLERNGVLLVSIREGIDGGTSTGRMHRNILGTFAEFERETIIDRIKSGIKEKAEQGEMVGPLPLGYVRDEAGAIVPEASIAPLVREMFEQYATGSYSLRDLARWAAQTGLKSTKGNPLDRLSIRKILTNVAYTGQIAFYARRGGGAIGNGKHAAIVDAATFAEVQGKLLDRRRATGNERVFGKERYPLSEVAICGHDGSGMVVALFGVKSVHSIAFFIIQSAILYLLHAGARGRSDRKAALAAGIALGESAIYAGNGFRCPLTGVAERLGAQSGAVTDIFLPKWLARNIANIYVPLLCVAVLLHGRNVARRKAAIDTPTPSVVT